MTKGDDSPIISISIRRPNDAQPAANAAARADTEVEIGKKKLKAGKNSIGYGSKNDIQLRHQRLGDPHLEITVTPGSDSMLTLLVKSDYLQITLNGKELKPYTPAQLKDEALIVIDFYELKYTAHASNMPLPAAPPDQDIHIEQAPISFPSPPSIENLPPFDSRFSRHIVETEVSRYLYDLPAIYHDTATTFLGRYLRIFEAIWEPFETRQDHIQLYFDPRSCPAAYLDWLESWFGITFSRSWPEERRRWLLRRIGFLYHECGSKQALAELIAIYTGIAPDIDLAKAAHVIDIDLRLPPDAEWDDPIVHAIIQDFKPAHLGYRIIK